MGGHAAEARLHLDGRKEVGGLQGHFPQRQRRPAHVEAGEVVGVVHHPRLDHGMGAAAAFLRRLEQELDPAAPVRVLGQQLGGAEADGDVGVVSAGMHDRGLPGCETLGHRRVRRIGGLGHLGGVHVEAESHGGAVATLQNAHGSRDLDVPGQIARLGPALLHHRVVGPSAYGVRMDAVGSRLHPISQLPQPVHHDAGGAELGPAGLRVAVQAAPDVGHARQLALRLPGKLFQVFSDVLGHGAFITPNREGSNGDRGRVSGSRILRSARRSATDPPGRGRVPRRSSPRGGRRAGAPPAVSNAPV